MPNESGTWIMYGVEWDDPECLHTVDEAYKESPDDSGVRIAQHISEVYPIATADQIGNIIGAKTEDRKKPVKKA